MDQNRLPESLQTFLSGSNFPWAVCGGFALDLFLDKQIRVHGDLDVCVFEKDRASVLEYMLDAGWNVYEFRGQGKVRRLEAGMASESGRNLMCLKAGCDLVAFCPCEDAGMQYHQFIHTGMKEFHYLEFLFNDVHEGSLVVNPGKELHRELGKAILRCKGIPCLAPEIALLYKASHFRNPDYQMDFEATYPQLNDDQRMWFLQGMKLLYPAGHAWIP